MLGQHKVINLGESKSGEEINLYMKRNGVVLVISKPRTGKSAMVKEIALRINESGRPLLIIDSMGKGEWTATKKMNYRARYPAAFSNLEVLKNFALPIKSFTTLDDFLSLGFSNDAAGYMTEWVGKKFLQDPKNMRDFLFNLPVSINQLDGFNAKFMPKGVALTSTIHYLTKNNLMSHWRRIEQWFWRGEKDSRKKLDSRELQDIWSKHHFLCLQVDVESGEKYKSIAYVGNLLSNLQDSFLRRMKPVVIVEEADLLAPHERFDKTPLTSRSILRYWVNKKLRYNIWIFFITQSERLLDEEIVRSAFDRIVGVVDTKSTLWNRAKYNRLKNIDGVQRSDFVYVDINEWGKQFYPKITSCGCRS